MKHLITTIIYLLIALIFTSCSGRKVKELKSPYGEQVFEKYEYIETSNGSFLKDGFYKNWHGNGQIHEDGNYKKNKKSGKWTIYNSDGSLNRVEHFEDGLLDGESIAYYKNGNKKYEENYKENKRHGSSTKWYQDGNIEHKTSYITGEFDNDFVSYFANGKKQSLGKYDNGMKIGKWKTFNKEGELFIEEEFKDGVNVTLVGKWKINDSYTTEYFEDGTSVVSSDKGKHQKKKYELLGNRIKIGYKYYKIVKLNGDEYELVQKSWKDKIYKAVRIS